MNKSRFSTLFSLCTLLFISLISLNLNAQEKSSNDELPEFRNFIGVNAGRAMPFVRTDNSLVHYMRITDNGNFHKHTVLFDIDNYDSEVAVGDTLNMYTQLTDGTNTLVGYNFAFGKRKQVHKKVVLHYGPQAGFRYTDVRKDVTFTGSSEEPNRVDTGEYFQMSGGVMGGIQFLLTPRFSMYTEASFLARYNRNKTSTAGISNGTNTFISSRLNISKNLVFFYSF